jgi:short-subunit dehydrogenase
VGDGEQSIYAAADVTVAALSERRREILDSAVRDSRYSIGAMKRYLITGASRGIGRAIAEKLAAKDVTLLLHGRDTVALAQTRKAIEPQCAEAVLLIHDLATPAGVSDLVVEVGKERIDLLVNNAAVAVVKPFTEITRIEWEQTIGVNITAPFMLTQHFALKMPPGSSIVNILSIAAKTGFANWSAYCMSKFALEGFSQSVREELRDRRIRVINVYPAATDTEIWDQIEGKWPRHRMISATQIADAVAFALARPTDTLVENITLGKLSGSL